MQKYNKKNQISKLLARKISYKDREYPKLISNDESYLLVWC